LEELAERFFPRIPTDERDASVYPKPLSEGFWHLYSESVGFFVGYAGYLLRAVEDVGRAHAEAVATQTFPSYGSHFWFANNRLMDFAQSVNPVLAIDEESLKLARVWSFPSLLASYAAMAMEDLADEQALHECPVCRTPFLSKAYQAKYCSTTCRWRGQKRQWRARRRVK
jgi:hypothetical protein